MGPISIEEQQFYNPYSSSLEHRNTHAEPYFHLVTLFHLYRREIQNAQLDVILRRLVSPTRCFPNWSMEDFKHYRAPECIPARVHHGSVETGK